MKEIAVVSFFLYCEPLLIACVLPTEKHLITNLTIFLYEIKAVHMSISLSELYVPSMWSLKK